MEEYCTQGVDPQVSQAVLATTKIFRDLGASIHEVKLSLSATPFWSTHAVEAAAVHEQWFPSRASEYGPTFRAFLQQAVKVSGIDYVKAQVERQGLRRMIDDLFQKVDLLLCPSTSGLPVLLKDLPPDIVLSPEATVELLRHTAPFDLTGSPTISVPCGFSTEGLPLSLQLIGRYDEEGLVMQAGHAYEQATEWHKRQLAV